MNKQFSTMKKGFDTDEVEEYVNKLESDLRKYQKKEASISSALVSASESANKIENDALLKVKEIENDALKKLDLIKEKTLNSKSKLEAFQKKYNAFVQDYLVAIQNHDIVSLFDDLDNLLDNIEKSKDEAAITIKKE